MSPVTLVVETPLELTPRLHFALVSHAVRKILAAPTPPQVLAVSQTLQLCSG